MAIYSLNHSAIGRTTHATGTAGAHVRYITRTQAEPVVLANHIPANRNRARAWIEAHEAGSRKNARVCDKLIIALPLELNAEQQAALVRDFCDQATSGRAPYFAAIHAAGKDAANPHVHVLLVDRDVTTRKRVMETTERHSTERFRERWELLCNLHLARAGLVVRVNHRSLADQGSDRIPQIHVGYGDQTVNTERPSSKVRVVRNGAGAKSRTRRVDYNPIDRGRTRREFNDQIIDANLERAKRSPDFGTRKRAELTQQLRAREKAERSGFVERRRLLTVEGRDARAKAWAAHRQAIAVITAARDQELADAKAKAREAVALDRSRFAEDKTAAWKGVKEVRDQAALKTKTGHAAIKAMKRGPDYVGGHLRAIYKEAATADQPVKALRKAEALREADLRRQEKALLRMATAAIKERSGAAVKAERTRYATDRTERNEAQRQAFATLRTDQSTATLGRKEFASQQEAQIAKIAAAIDRTAATWSRGSERSAPAANRPTAEFSRAKADRGLGRG